MKIIKNKWFPFKGYKCINLFGFVFTKSNLNEVDINHEAIHTAQMKELLYIGFYILYGIEYMVRRILDLSSPQNEIYHDVSFEQEAQYYEKNLAYLRYRKHYSWINFLSTE